jgi:hypothetical protein
MNARLNAFIVPDLLLTQPPLSSPTSYPTCCSRSYQFHRTRPAAHAATLINTRTQPAAAAMGNYRNALLNTPSAETHVSGLTRCSGNPADTDISTFIVPDLLLTQPPWTIPEPNLQLTLWTTTGTLPDLLLTQPHLNTR